MSDDLNKPIVCEDDRAPRVPGSPMACPSVEAHEAPPGWCPKRTGPDRLQAFDAWRELAGTMGATERLLAIEKAARAVVRWSWPEMPQQWRDDIEALRVALGERKDGGT